MLRTLAVGLGRFAAENSVAVLAVIMALTAALVPFAVGIGYDDDVLKFLPEDDPEVVRFQAIGERFHGLSLALIGVEAPEGEDLFEAKRLKTIRAITRSLPEIEGVAFASSLTELQDIVEQEAEDGEKLTIVSDLVGELPDADDPDAASRMTALEERVMARDHIVGSFISPDARSTMILCRIDAEGSVKPTVDAIRSRVEAELASAGQPFTVYYGGAPFIGSYVSDGARADIIKLSPFVCAAVILIILLTARSFAGVIVALGSVGIGIVWVIGLQSALGQPLTLVSSSLPVLLVALGSAYSIHMLTSVLGRLDEAARDAPSLDGVDPAAPLPANDARGVRKAAVLASVEAVGPPIFVAGLTSALGFLSFLVMDIAPMREFGLLMFFGTMIIVVLALLVVPAACVVLPLKARDEGRAPVWVVNLLAQGTRAISKRPVIMGAVIVALIAGAAFLTSKVQTHMDTSRLFKPGSEPVLAERFLEEKLGGAHFLQVEVRGDIKNPLVLHQISRLANIARAQEGVSDVQSVADVMVLASSGLTGEDRIPSNPKAARSVATLVDEDPNLRLLVDDDWTASLIQIKLRGFDTAQATALGAKLSEEARALDGARVSVQRADLSDAARELERDEVRRDLRAVLEAAGVDTVEPEALDGILGKSGSVDMSGEVVEKIEAILNREIVEDQMVYVRDDVDVKRDLTDKAVAAMREDRLDGDGFFELIKRVANEEDLEDLELLRKTSDYLYAQLVDVVKNEKKRMKAQRLLSILPDSAPPELRGDVERTIAVLQDPVAMLPADAASELPSQERADVTIEVSGYPMVYAGMNESVQRNQTNSLGVAVLLVIAALAWFFRSIKLALIAAFPAALTLLFIFGIMGGLDIRMDVGTSMIASIGMGVGIDYAVHLVWRHGVPTPANQETRLVASLSETGWGIIINALEVTAGFALLAFGTIVPMQNFGLLTASAMIVSAVATLLLVPAMIRLLLVRPEANVDNTATAT